jgi:putative DNA primase/helicase
MVAAERGIGKTYFALSLATALSTGISFMHWPIDQATGVLYVDGEMALTNIRDRLKLFAPYPFSQSLSILSHEWFYKYFERDLTITDPDIQATLLKKLDTHKQLQVLILDNLSSLTRIREDKSDDWRQCMLPFLIQCRRRGIAVILVHHCGKSGDQRGTGAREDHLDTSIKLTRTIYRTHDTGCSFQVSFTKARSCYGETIAPFIATLQISKCEALWKISKIEESSKDKLINLVKMKGEEGITVTKSAYELGLTKGMISRLKKQCEKGGILERSIRKNLMRISANWKR